MNRRLYAIHRWLSLIALLQLLAWSISGLFFASVPKAQLTGTPVEGAQDPPFDAPADLLPAAELVARAERLGVGKAQRLELRPSLGGPVAVVTGTTRRARLDARTGGERPVSREEAGVLARRDQPGEPATTTIEAVPEPRPTEYRGKRLPAWRVGLADGHGTILYVDGVTGEVTARRNDTWRVYDFLWGLHIMDYRGREDFRHALLIVAAVVAVLTATSGLVLWIVRAARALRSTPPRSRRGGP
jgi:uncharacterized iron-regulated membrane protein